MKRSHRLLVMALLATLTLTACRGGRDPFIFVTVTPSASSGQPIPPGEMIQPPPASTAGALPGAEGAPPTPAFIPTPNPTRPAVVDPTQDQIHVVQFGDTLNAIADRYGVAPESIMQANGLDNANLLSVGQSLIIPLGVRTVGPAFKIIPDSELVYGPELKGFDVEQAVSILPNSFLANYTEELDGRLWTGAEIIDRVAVEQSISPRLLLALLEYESGWLSQSMVTEDQALYPMGYRERPGQIYGLYRQLDWAGKMLQAGYYGWRQRGLSAVLLADGQRVGLDPTINAGTAGVQTLLAQTRSLDSWLAATQYSGFFNTYVSLFGDPFRFAVEPLIPPDLQQPEIGFPFGDDEVWYFTGGPHGGWGSSSAWAALDFVSAEEVGLGCDVSPDWARAVADGVIARSEYGLVILDLDGDGFEGTGWTIFYLHLSSEDRPVQEGQRVKKGDPIGHPSCEGGVSYATHLHIARRYNGEWIAADCSECMLEAPAPQLNMDGWLTYTFGKEYDGSMIKGEEYREACVCREPVNTFHLQALQATEAR
ncbi:MAG TPA: LysM peptidoglycan-binding domain-containing protein [Aggregatilineales bacterium]|nr:LysM peptidoglycan-binding domain-containing protein [Aggregatilineales bacterium]